MRKQWRNLPGLPKPDGVTREIIASNVTGLTAGGTIEVLYEAQAPEKARVNSFQELYLLPVLLGVIATVFMVLGILAPRIFVATKSGG